MQSLLQNPEIVQIQEHPTERNQPQRSTHRDPLHFELQQTAKLKKNTNGNQKRKQERKQKKR